MTASPAPFQAFRRDTMAAFVRADQQVAWQTLEEMGRTGKMNKIGFDYIVDRFVAGKQTPGMSSQWHTLAKVPITTEPATVRAKVRASLFRRPVLTTDTLPGAEPTLLPAVDLTPCEPFDRFYARRQLQGFGIDKFHYRSYLRSNQKVIRKTFEVYFEKNRAQADLTEIRQFLRANDLSILHASMEGFSSVEGAAERNRELQEQRARRMMYALQSFNTLPVQSDTILFTDAWEPFREELRRSPYGYLDSLDNESLRARVNGNDTLLAHFEPYFRQHRKATLKLTLAGTLSEQEVVHRLVSDFNYELKKVKAGDVPANREIEAKLLGMIDYFEKLSLAGKTGAMNIATLVDDCAFPYEARLLMFYHVVKKYEEHHSNGFHWDSTFVNQKWNNAFVVAANNAIRQAEGYGRFAGFAERKKRLEQLVDVQYYMFKYISLGILDPEVICELDYPDQAAYYGYKLNHLAMAYQLSKTIYFSCQGFEKISSTPVARLRADSASVDSLVSTVTADRITPPSAPGSRVPTYDRSEKGDYYYFVKKVAKDKAESMRKFVYTSDNYFEFDLYYLLRLNVSKWDPFANHFYDEDIGLVEMRSLVLQMKAIERNICPVEVQQLYLDFYMKSLFYLERYRTPGDTREMNLAEQSLRGISTYYASRPRMLFPKLVLLVTRQLHNFYWLPTRKSSVAYAFDVMAAADARRMLSYEEQEAWGTYLKLFKPRYKSYLPQDPVAPAPKSLIFKTAVAGE
jgi:hypothetical protein